jgi:hypothetical protein
VKRVRDFAFFFGAQALNYATITWNYRSTAQARYAHMFVSDMACAFLGYTLIKRIAETKSRVALAGYVLGGACGSVLSAYVSTLVFGS